MIVNFILNGNNVSLKTKEGEYLLDTLRDYGIKSLKKGCDASSCGVCTVLIDDKPFLSCSLLTHQVEGKSVKTVESIQDFASSLSDCFSHVGADQCGFCNSSMALTVYALLKENSSPSEEDIKNYIVGNLCRCSGYSSQVKAIKRFVEGIKHE